MNRKEAYREYLKTPHWEGLRKAAIKRDGNRCQNPRCGATGCVIQVHHKFYRARFEDTQLEDLTCRCLPCHEAIHQKPPKKHRWKKRHRNRTRKKKRARFRSYDNPNHKGWHAGMYEGITSYEASLQVGTNPSKRIWL